MSGTGLKVVVVGGGAAGFMGAITAKEKNPAADVTLLEASRAPLAKVRIAGGGRCNVTHNEPDPSKLTGNYPRGAKALRGPFTRFGPRETVAWFEQRGVTLKTEADGRMFPVTDDSATVIDSLLGAAEEARVNLRLRATVTAIEHASDGQFRVIIRNAEPLPADRLLLATGGAPVGYRMAAALGHTVEPLVPSIFTFNVDDERLSGLAGVSVKHVKIRLEGAKETHEGPLLITHWGVSGPAVLRASAWGARALHESGYKLPFTLNWLPALREDEVRAALNEAKQELARREVLTAGPFGLPQRLWRSLASAAGAIERQRWADASKALINALTRELHAGRYEVTGKGVFKEEFVTCGGVRLREVDFGTMESRLVPGLFFAGEVLDVDGITGGFNFQSAWTTGWLAGRAIAKPAIEESKHRE